MIQVVEENLLRWFGHLTRMNDSRIGTESNMEYQSYKKTWNININENLKERNLEWEQAIGTISKRQERMENSIHKQKLSVSQKYTRIWFSSGKSRSEQFRSLHFIFIIALNLHMHILIFK